MSFTFLIGIVTLGIFGVLTPTEIINGFGKPCPQDHKGPEVSIPGKRGRSASCGDGRSQGGKRPS